MRVRTPHRSRRRATQSPGPTKAAAEVIVAALLAQHPAPARPTPGARQPGQAGWTPATRVFLAANLLLFTVIVGFGLAGALLSAWYVVVPVSTAAAAVAAVSYRQVTRR